MNDWGAGDFETTNTDLASWSERRAYVLLPLTLYNSQKYLGRRLP